MTCRLVASSAVVNNWRLHVSSSVLPNPLLAEMKCRCRRLRKSSIVSLRNSKRSRSRMPIWLASVAQICPLYEPGASPDAVLTDSSIVIPNVFAAVAMRSNTDFSESPFRYSINGADPNNRHQAGASFSNSSRVHIDQNCKDRCTAFDGLLRLAVVIGRADRDARDQQHNRL